MYVNLYLVNRRHLLDQKATIVDSRFSLVCHLRIVGLSDEPNEVRHFMLSMGNIIDYTHDLYIASLTVKGKQEYILYCISHRFNCCAKWTD